MDAAGGAVSYVSNVTAQFSSLKTDPRPLAPWPHSAHPASPQIDATVLQQQTAASPPPSPSQANLSRIESTFKNCLNLTWLAKYQTNWGFHNRCATLLSKYEEQRPARAPLGAEDSPTVTLMGL